MHRYLDHTTVVCQRPVALQERDRDFVVVVGLSVDDGPVADVREYVKAQRVNYPVAIVSGTSP